MKNKLFLIDAYALIYRSYYAFIKNPRFNSKGFNTSAILGFVNVLEEILKTESPSHIAVAFDPSGPTFRHEAYEEYKAQREATPEDIKLSVPIIKQIVAAYNIPILEVPGFEADDVIGTISKLAEQSDFNVYMLTPDKDYAQLVSDKVFIYRPRHGGGYETLDVQGVKDKWGISSPSQVIDLLGLMGDSSDNIPGCPGVGEKTAVKLLNDFNSIDNLLNSTDSLKGALKQKIIDNCEKIKFSKFLATIRTDVPIEFEPEKFILASPNVVSLCEIFSELEFKSLLKKYSGDKKSSQKADLQPSLFDEFLDEDTGIFKYSNLSELNLSEVKYQLIDNQKDMDEFLLKISTQDFFCFDVETTGISPYSDDLVGISFSWVKNEAYFIFLPVDREEAEKFLHQLKPIFNDVSKLKIGQNLKFDISFLESYGVSVKGPFFDTMIAHYLLQPELKHNLDYLAEVFLNYKMISYEDLCGEKGRGQLPIRSVSKEALTNYACEDADITLQLKSILEEQIHSENLDNLFYNIELPLLSVLIDVERAGVSLDVASLTSSSKLLSAKMSEIEKTVFDIVGFEFNLSSPKQVGEVIFDKLRIIENAKKTKTGQYSTSEEVLESLRGKHEVIDYILEYRGIKKLLSTYIDSLPLLLNSKTHKLHTSFNQCITSTGRLSSSNPNLQNIPIRDELGKEVRKAFISDENCYFLSADYSQIELRIMAHLSEDENLIEAFHSGYDIHSATAAKIFKVSLEDVTSDMRRKAKTANFGIIYGISVFGLAERLSIPRSEAKELIDGYFALYPKVKDYMSNIISSAKDKGFVQTLFNRKRFLPDINSRNSVVRGFSERNAINAPIQGTAADIIKLAMVNIHKRFTSEKLQSKMILQVHDELNFNVVEEELDIVKSIVVSEMESVIQLKVPLVVECGVGKNWLEAH